MLTIHSVKKPFTVFVAVVIVAVFGFVALYKMTPDLFPEINAPVSVVLTTNPGATAEENETAITDPIEDQLATLSNVKNLTSYSMDNYSIIMLEFTDDVDMDSMTVNMRDKLDLIEGYLPENAAKPVVMKIDMNMMPVTVAAVGMKGKSPAEISTFVKEELDNKLESIEGVGSVSKVGMVDEGIQIVLSQDRIDEINDDVAAAIESKFNDGTSQIKSGINKAKNGKKQLEKGKDAITDGTDKANDSIPDLQKSKQQLLDAKKSFTELWKGYEKLVEEETKLNAQLAQFPDPNMPEAIALRAQLDAVTASKAELEKTMKSFGYKTPEAFKEYLDGIDKQVESINDAIDNIQGQVVSGNFTYSDLAATESTLDSTIAQLQSTLADVEAQKDEAVKNADMSGVITMENISSILSAQNFSMPAGYVTDGEADILVSVGDKIKNTDELKNLILFDLGIDGIDPIRVKDIATVSYLADDSENYAKINGENGILLTFNKQSTYATATVADNISAEFEKLEKKYDGLEFTSLMDQGEYIHTVINSVGKDLLLGALFAILILLFFLRDIRPTVITAVSIPVSVIFALALMYFTGVTLNMISLSGLAIGVGMLVDNSIVVIENIYRLRSKGYSAVQAAVSGASQVAGAITASTLTTICVFVPIIFVDGITKQIFTDLALTVTYSLVASLIIALSFVPAVAKGLLVKKTGKTVLGQGGRVVRWYRNAAAWALCHKKRLVLAALAILIASAGGLLIKGFEFMPAMSTSQISASVTMPEDSTIKDTAKVNDAISEEIRKIDGVEDVGIMLSTNMADMFGVSAQGQETDVTQTTMYIIMDESKLKQSEVVASTLAKAARKYSCEIVTSADMDLTQYMGGSGVTVNLYSDDLDKLRKSGMALEKRLSEMESLEEISDITADSTEEIHITVDKNLAMKHGLTVAQVYQQIAAKLTKEKNATELKQEGNSININIENSTKNSFTVENLREMKLDEGDSAKSDDSGDDSGKVMLSSITTIQKDAAMNTINHDNQKRSLQVTAGVKDGYNITKVSSEVRNIIRDEEILKNGVTAEFNGENEEIMDSMRQLLLMMLVGIILVYLIMVAQFQSLRSPFIIIFTLPLAFTGGFIALLVSNQVLSVVAMFGFVMLVGIVVNNGIVLVDCINRYRLEGMDRDTAIIEAGAVRMRPVLMTAATTVLGLIPLALGFGQGAEMVQPVAIVCIGGLLYATITTLFIIPVMYRWLSRKHMEKIADEELEIVNV